MCIYAYSYTHSFRADRSDSLLDGFVWNDYNIIEIIIIQIILCKR